LRAFDKFDNTVSYKYIPKMSKSMIGEICRDFVSMIFPDYCLGCEDALVKGENLLCTRCQLELPATNHHIDVSNPLKMRLATRMQIEHAMAMFKFSKSGKVQALLHALKYRNQPELGVMLGSMYGQKLQGVPGLVFDMIIPVPLHPVRRRKRGYNQSAMFAKGLSEKLLIPFSDSLMSRGVMTATQTKKSKLSRWQNVSDVFHLAGEDQIKEKRILLVDDVVTTGATLESCAVPLLNAHCASLSIACIAEA
jgi:ComF family protein